MQISTVNFAENSDPAKTERTERSKENFSCFTVITSKAAVPFAQVL